jgi:hypothetical protein
MVMASLVFVPDARGGGDTAAQQRDHRANRPISQNFLTFPALG